MEEKQLQVFVDSVVNYFSVIPQNDVSVGTPFLRKSETSEQFEVSGVIGISGSRSGWVCYTAPRMMLRHLLLSMGETDTSRENIRDIAGEVANTISGNLRKAFGSKFLISVPDVYEGEQTYDAVADNDRCYVVPIYWGQYHSSMVVYLH